MKTSRLRVTMREVEPTVVRVLDVPEGVLLPELHDLLQAALGWTDSHLHQFVADGICYGMPDLDGPDDELDESGVTLRALPDRFDYLYDFGDGWEHEVVVVGPGGDRPGVVAGEAACPPEDVGGPHGYAEFRQVMADPEHLERDRLRTWAGRWHDGFDLDAADLLLRQTVGMVPAPVRLVFGLAADGVKLTPGGRLPRAVVRQVQECYPSWQLTESPASLEEGLPPLAALHELLRHVGLLRLRKGVLGPTRAATADVEVIRRLRSWFGPDDSFISVLAGEGLASLVVDGTCRLEALAPRLLPRLGDGWVTSQGQRLDERRIRHELYLLESVLVGLDLIQTDKGAWTAGPSALWLLPRATALAHIWSDGHPST
ncbi:MAG: plasmid pRiA4b ORF-3 family protein [Acidimicrobiales bacterium]